MRRFFVFAFLTFGLLVVTQQVSAAGITMPCNGPDCQACHIVQLGQTVINWLIGITASIIMLVFAIGGLKMVMAGGDTGAVTNAKHMMTNAVVGFILLLGSWLIINTILVLFTKDSVSTSWFKVDCLPKIPRTQTTPTTPAVTAGTQTGTTAAGQLTHEEAMRRLAEGGVTVTSTGGVVQANCTGTSGCTSLQNINASTIQDAIDLHNACNCAVSITAGTEAGHSTNNTMNHGNGYKYDIQPTAALDTYITTNYANSGIRRDGARMYTAPDGTIYARESTHWDVRVPS